jgi:hypothetical protein
MKMPETLTTGIFPLCNLGQCSININNIICAALPKGLMTKAETGMVTKQYAQQILQMQMHL